MHAFFGQLEKPSNKPKIKIDGKRVSQFSRYSMCFHKCWAKVSACTRFGNSPAPQPPV